MEKKCIFFMISLISCLFLANCGYTSQQIISMTEGAWTPTPIPKPTYTLTPIHQVLEVTWENPCKYADDPSILSTMHGYLSMLIVEDAMGSDRWITSLDGCDPGCNPGTEIKRITVTILSGNGPNQFAISSTYQGIGGIRTFNREDMHLYDVQGNEIDDGYYVWVTGEMVSTVSQSYDYMCLLRITQIRDIP
jgi:hypothetical protein